MRKPRVFFAIPCGEFFQPQRSSIRAICEAIKVEPVIVEDHLGTSSLWGKITTRIDGSRLFMADISSRSVNVLTELGYALSSKKASTIGIFASEAADVPVDLQGFVIQKYRCMTSFESQLFQWLTSSLMIQGTCCDWTPQGTQFSFSESFMDPVQFNRLWWKPMGSQFHIEPGVGLHITDCHIPIMTTHLGLLQECSFEFIGRIDSMRLGWVVKGSSTGSQGFPSFCVMFNIDTDGLVTPHVFDIHHLPSSGLGYQHFRRHQTGIGMKAGSWHKIRTDVRQDCIDIFIDGYRRCRFRLDGKQVEGWMQGRSIPTGGQIGFRCHQGEVATVGHVRVVAL
jgi:hypothetical protein